MVFEAFADARSFLLAATFVLALILGAVARKTNFCTLGAVSDWVNMGDLGRMRSWLLAIAVALLGVVLLESTGLVKVADSFPAYRAPQLAWANHLLGGLLFGIGMTLGSGCGNRTLIRLGGGNLKSVVVCLILAVVAYFMINPFPGTDKTLYSVLFHGWLGPLAIDLGAPQDLGTLAAGPDRAPAARLAIGGVLALGLLAFAFRSADFRGNRDHVVGGLVVGAAVVAAWVLTSNVLVHVENETLPLRDFVQQWDFFGIPEATRPADTRGLAPQSFTFVSPLAQTLGFLSSGFKATLLTFGVAAVAGVLAGSLLWSLATRSFRIEWFASLEDLLNHVAGATMMGLGGVLAMGCTIGQGVTGIATLAAGSFLTFFAIVAGSAATMKYQYWRIMRAA